MSAPSRRQISEVVLEMLKSKNAEEVSQSLANYLVANRRTRELTQIMRDIELLRLSREGIAEATAISAFELSDATRKEIESNLGDPKMKFNYQTDPSVLGGVKIRALDWQLDLSVAGKLKQLKQLTTKAN